MSNHDDFNFEPVRGLPERLPEGEHILWQGRPSTRMLAREALSTRTVAIYFGVVAALRVIISTASFPLPTALGHAVPILMIGVVAIAILYGVAFAQARSTVYIGRQRFWVCRCWHWVLRQLVILHHANDPRRLRRFSGGNGDLGLD